jgi:hypothetical protein
MMMGSASSPGFDVSTCFFVHVPFFFDKTAGEGRSLALHFLLYNFHLPIRLNVLHC